MGQDTKRSGQLAGVGQTAAKQYNQLYGSPTGLESEFTPISQQFINAYNVARDQQAGDYGNIMGGYQNFFDTLQGQQPRSYSAQNVTAGRPAELPESYGYLRETVPGYREFAETGGYSPTDIEELRARGISPIRSAYGNTMMEMNRARALGGDGGAPNYIAAASRAQRELPGQMAEATTGVNAKLAEDIRTGKLAGLAGIAGVGSTMGGLSSAEAARMLQAAIANQSANLQAQQLSGASEQALWGAKLAALGGQTGLYGTTPAMAATFGNQALQAYQQRAGQEQMRNQFGMGLLDAQIRAYGAQTPQQSWLNKLMGVAGSVAPYAANMLGGGGGGGSSGVGSTDYGGYSDGGYGYGGPGEIYGGTWPGIGEDGYGGGGPTDQDYIDWMNEMYGNWGNS